MSIKFIFLDEKMSEEISLPVNPAVYSFEHGIKKEVVTLTEHGDINLPGKRYMGQIQIECIFPANRYPFINSGAVIDPYYYVKKFEQWCDNQTILRFIISSTNINTTCFIESIAFSEKDGTRDVYAKINISQYRVLKKISSNDTAMTGNNARSEIETSTEEKSYKIVSGDTLSALCRKFYGDASLYNKLASVNGISNANLIYPGTVIKIPNKASL